jgi:uncharacterized membrane protein
MSMSWRKRILLTAMPLALLLVAGGAAALAFPPPELGPLFGLALLTFPAGRLVAFAPLANDGLAFSPLYIAAVVFVVEASIALFVSVNLDVLSRLPRIGATLRAMELGGEATLARYPWIRRLTVAGVVIFMSLPLPSTGPVGGTLVARLVGLGPTRSFAAVAVGNATGAYILALAAHAFVTWLPPGGGGPLGIVRAAAVIAVVGLLVYLGYRRSRSRSPTLQG